MTTPNTPHDNNNSLLDNLREPFQAWVSAGARLGDVVSDFADRLRADRERQEPVEGAHALHDPVAGEESAAERFKAAAQQARTGLSDAKTTEEYKNVSLAFVGHAEDIIRDLAGSVRRAADESKDSTAASEAKIAFNTAVASVRSTFDDTVEQARARRATSGSGSDEAGEQSVIDDLRHRLEGLIARAGDLVNRDNTDNTDATAPGEAERFTPTAPATDGSGEVPHMIDGEVVSSEDVPTTDSTNTTNTTDKDN